MAVGYRATSAAMAMSAGGTTPAIPVGTAAGDIMILLHWGKIAATPYTPANPAGWTPIGTNSVQSGTTLAGVDTGSVTCSCWYRLWVTGDAAPTVPALNLNSAGSVIMSFSKAAGEAWVTPTKATATEEGADTSVNATFNTSLAAAAGDMVCGGVGFRSDAAVPMATHFTWTATGATWTHTHDTAGAAGDNLTTLGGDMSFCLNRATLTGTQSAAAVAAGTMAAAHWYAAQQVLLRVTAGATVTPRQPIVVGTAVDSSFNW